MIEKLLNQIIIILKDLHKLDSPIVLLVILIVISVMVLDFVLLGADKKKEATGIRKTAKPFQLEGSQSIPAKNYISESYGLSGRPDALIIENGCVIPVEVKPTAKKLRDRYIAQLLVYMRLIEEFEGKKPEYGYLILGKNNKRFRIDNTKERQEWLEKMLIEMRGILNGKEAIPLPQLQKCNKCNVKESCKYRFGRARV